MGITDRAQSSGYHYAFLFTQQEDGNRKCIRYEPKSIADIEVEFDVSNALGFITYPLSASILLLGEQERRYLQNGSHCYELDL